jgi:homoserine dehydrogenase
MKRKNITIGLFGFGCVGNGLYEVVEKSPGLKINIKRICVKDKHKKREIQSQLFTYDKNDILNDDEINTVVELIDDADSAFEIVKQALKKGKAVVTANKKMIAEHFEELLQLQKENNVPLLYEAACCASIPIVRNLEEYYDNDLLESIQGIVNGSTNYILSKISSENISYDEALYQAKIKGYAESNPIMDTGGFDAKYKLLILMVHAFGLIVKPDQIFNLGVNRMGNTELNYAREKGLKIKLVAYAEKTKQEKIHAFVMPKFIHNDDRLFSVDDVFNGIKTKTFFSDEQFFVGKGAGAFPTSSAVLSDISAISYDYKYEYKKINQCQSLGIDDNLLLKIFLSSDSKYSVEVNSFFEEINETYQSATSGYVIGIISLNKLKELVKWEEIKSSFVLFDVVKH